MLQILKRVVRSYDQRVLCTFSSQKLAINLPVEFSYARNLIALLHSTATTTAAGGATQQNSPTEVFPDFKVAVFSAKRYVKQFLRDPLTNVFPNNVFLESKLDPVTARLAEGCSAVNLFVNDDCTEKVIEELASRGVKYITMRCAGYDRVDVSAVHAAGMKIAHVPSYSPTSVAEHAVSLMLGLARNLHLAYARVRHGNYGLSGLVGFELSGKTVGVIGTGKIGTEVCRILKGFNCRLLAYDISQNPDVLQYGVQYVADVDDMLAEADIITLHWPLLPSTHHFINQSRLEKMKAGSMLINVSRGGLVDTQALIEGLQTGQIGYAGMDVYENEDDLFFTDYTKQSSDERMQKWDQRFALLKSYPTVLVTPHIAFLTHEALRNIATTTVLNLKEMAQGLPLTNEVMQ